MNNIKTQLIINPVFERRDFEYDEKLCFVLMPLAADFLPIYEDSIRPTVEKLDLKCRRADEIFDVREIMEDVWEYISRARLVIAELTGRNPNVFYELGIAHTLGKDVISIAQTLDDVPFDIRHRRHIIYSYTPRGIKQLEQRLEETIHSIINRPTPHTPTIYAPIIETVREKPEPTIPALPTGVSALGVEIETLQAIAWATKDIEQQRNTARRLVELGAPDRAALVLSQAIIKADSNDKDYLVNSLVDDLIGLGESGIPSLERVVRVKRQWDTKILQALINLHRYDIALPKLGQMLMSEHSSARVQMLTPAGKEAFHQMKKIALFSSDPQNRIQAAKWLASQGEWDFATGVLKEMALYSVKEDEREDAAHSLASVKMLFQS